jgi:hypothetical protein
MGDSASDHGYKPEGNNALGVILNQNFDGSGLFRISFFTDDPRILSYARPLEGTAC